MQQIAPLLVFVFLLIGCAKQQNTTLSFYTMETNTSAAMEVVSLHPAGQHLKSWKELAPSVAASRTYVATRDPEEVAIAREETTVTWGEIAESLALLEKLLPRLDAEPKLLASSFQWLGLTDGAGFSGYYEPVFNASYRKTQKYAYPIYRLPPDLKRLDLGKFRPEYIGQRLEYRLDQHEQVVPYYTRAEIDKGILSGQKLELAWLADPIDVFFLQIQGSGRLHFTDGRELPVGFAGTNGRLYHSIGRYLRDQGYIPPDKMSMDSIRAWLNAHPNDLERVLHRNDRYVFFRHGDTASPVGSMGRPLMPWISLAVDRAVFPLGAPLVFAVDVPTPAKDGASVLRSIHGIGFAQDTGAAILGRRVDLFCGRGEKAAFAAGRLNAPGQIWLLLPKKTKN